MPLPRSARRAARHERGTARLLVPAGLLLALAVVATLWWADPVAPQGAVVVPSPVGSGGPVLREPPPGAAPTTTPAPAPDPVSAEPLRTEPASGRFGPTIPRRGRTASLSVVVTRNGLPTPASVRITVGADAGRLLTADDEGLHVADELLPGQVVIAITAGDLRWTREVLLRHRRDVRVDCDFGDHGRIAGTVRGPDGQPLAGAAIRMGQLETRSGPDGGFRIDRLVSGPAALIVRLPGHATHRQHVGASDDGRQDSLDITLRPAARLTIDVPPAAGVSGDVELVLVPSGDPSHFAAGALHPTYPWSDLYPSRVPVGGRLVLDDLPTCRLDVVVLHPLADARPLSAWCRPGVDLSVAVDWVPRAPLEVTVLRGERPEPAAAVALRVANPASERVLALGEHRRALDRFPLSALGVIEQQVETDGAGHAALGLAVDEAFVVVRSADGATEVVRSVRRGDDALVIDLARPDA